MLVTRVMAATVMAAFVLSSSQIRGGSPSGCPPPMSPRRGTYQLGADKSWVEFFCQPGLSLVGNEELSCVNGRWSSQPPVCVGADCEMPVVRHGVMVSMHGGGMVRVQCRPGFHLSGASSEYLACIDGVWNDTIPECIANKKDNGGKVGGVLGNSLLTAGKSAKTEEKWKKDPQEWLELADYTCIRDDFNVHPPIVPNARGITKWTMYQGRPRLYTTYQCKWGYKPTAGGVRSVYCQDGTWVGSTPKCQTVVYEEGLQGDFLGNANSLSHDQLLLYADYSCIVSSPDGSIDPPVPDNATPTLRFIILEGMPHLYAQYVCKEGFQLEHENKAHMYCKAKNWIGDPPKCVKVTSKQSCTIQNGGCHQMCSYDNYRQITCSCKPGFQLQTDKKTCEDIDECEVNSGDCGHLCDNLIGSFECSCFDGYALASDKRSCKRVQKEQKKLN